MNSRIPGSKKKHTVINEADCSDLEVLLEEAVNSLWEAALETSVNREEEGKTTGKYHFVLTVEDDG